MIRPTRRSAGFGINIRCLVLLLLPGFLVACGHYQLGKPAGVPFQAVFIQPVENRSYAPQAQALLHRQIAEALLQRQIRTVSSPELADAILVTRLTDFRRRIGVTQETDTALAGNFILILEAEVTLEKKGLDAVWFRNRPVDADIQVFIDSGLQPAEYQATPVLTRRLAENIADVVSSTW